MQMRCKSLCALYVYGQYMGAIWLQWSILTTHLYETYKGHILDIQ